MSSICRNIYKETDAHNNLHISVEVSVFALPIFPVSAMYCRAAVKCPVDTCRRKCVTHMYRKKALLKQRLEFALPIFLVSARIVAPSVSVRWTLTGAKNLHISVEASVFALPIFPASHPASIVGVHELNFCVRDGNRWTLMTINTNSNCSCNLIADRKSVV